jgi:hypothetical protein
MSSQSQISVCNLALLSIGARAQVSALSDGSTAGDACATLFSFVFEQLARTAQWGCLKKQLNLTLVQAAQGTPENPTGTLFQLPPQPWLYAYTYPLDCLLMQQILSPILPTTGGGIPQTSISNTITPWIPGQYAIPYTVGYSNDASGNPLEVILTDQEQAIANYTVNQQNPQSWDSLFTSAFVASLAAYLVPALSLDKQFAAQQIQIADRMIAKARAMDGNEAVTIQDHIPDWVRARQGATGTLRQSTGYNAYGYINMAWGG